MPYSLDPMHRGVRWGRMPNRCVPSFLAALVSAFGVLAAPGSQAWAQTAVTACEQVLKGDGYLTGDLDCEPEDEAAVEIRNGGTLDMRGFSIHGGEYGVLCDAEAENGELVGKYTSCKVYGGGGTISGTSVIGIVGRGLVVTDLTIDQQTGIALIVHKKIQLSNVTLQLGANADGFMVGSLVKIGGTGLSMVGGAIAIEGEGGILAVDGLTASGYGRFAWLLKTVKVRHASLTGGATGFKDIGTVTLRDSTVSGHTGTAIEAERITLMDSTVGGNGLDLDADREPKLIRSSCDTSNGWGVCAND